MSKLTTTSVGDGTPQGILFYVQHLLGSGHVRRIALIVRALQQISPLTITVVQGGFPIPGVDFGTAQVIQLPPARVANAQFNPILDDTGSPISEPWKHNRARILGQLFQEIAPRILLTESYPFGRRAFSFEIDPLLEKARQTGTKVLSSVRDILVSSAKPQRVQSVVDTLQHFYHRVLVHGDPKLIPFEATFAAVDQIAAQICYTGYVANRPKASQSDSPSCDSLSCDSPSCDSPSCVRQPGVVVSVGGGAVGFHVLQAALEARSMSSLNEIPWLLLCGSELPLSDFDRLGQQAADTGIAIERHRNDFSALLRRCVVSISQAGYNTTLDVLSARCRAILIPFASCGQSEQVTRARLLAQQALVQVVEESELTPAAVAGTIDRIMAAPSPLDISPDPLRIFDLQGAEQSAKLIDQFYQTA